MFLFNNWFERKTDKILNRSKTSGITPILILNSFASYKIAKSKK